MSKLLYAWVCLTPCHLHCGQLPIKVCLMWGSSSVYSDERVTARIRNFLSVVWSQTCSFYTHIGKYIQIYSPVHIYSKCVIFGNWFEVYVKLGTTFFSFEVNLSGQSCTSKDVRNIYRPIHIYFNHSCWAGKLIFE